MDSISYHFSYLQEKEILALCTTHCQANEVLELLCRMQNFDPDSKIRAVCSAFRQQEFCGQVTSCPAVFIFLSAYLDNSGLSSAEISQWISAFRIYLGKQVPVSELSNMLSLTINYLQEHTEGLLHFEEKRSENPSEYYKSIYHDREHVFRHFQYSLEDKLTHAVVQADEASAMQMFREIKDSGSKSVLATDSVRSAKNSIICSCVLLTRAAIQAGVAPHEAFSLSDAVIKQIEELHTCRDVLKYEEDILMLFIRLVKRSTHDTISLTSRRAIQFIDAHLSENPSLATIADYAGVNPNYLSGLFHKEMSMSLSKYITMRKINESLYFLKYSSYAIADIAMLYGFSSQSYYTSVFRKAMGMTPAAFRADAKNKQKQVNFLIKK